MTETRVLTIDDDKAFSDTVRFVLEQEEYTIIQALDGTHGIALAVMHRPDVILCDVRMSDGHGYAIVQQLRQQPATRDIPVIMLTGYASPYGKRRSEMAGADYYLSKPISIRNLVETIRLALTRGRGAKIKRSPDLIFPEDNEPGDEFGASRSR